MSTNPDSMNDWLKKILVVHTVTRPNLRADEFRVFIGQKFLMDLFDTDEDMSKETNVMLEYPERWLNILEQRALYFALYEKCPNLEKILIKTHSPHILTCSPNGTVFVIDDTSLFPELKYAPGVRYSPVETSENNLMALGATFIRAS